MTPEAYIRRLYPRREDQVSFVCVPRSGEKDQRVQQRIFTAEKAASKDVHAWLRHMNARRHDVFVGMNPIKEGRWLKEEGRRRGRLKRDVARVERVYLDLDDDAKASLRKIGAGVRAGTVPAPTYVIQSSPGRAQAIWQLKPEPALSHDRAEALLRGLVAEYGGDRAATDVTRCLRLPGYRNWKRGGCDVDIVRRTDTQAAPGDFATRLYTEPEAARRDPGAGTWRPTATGGGDPTRSGDDFRYALSALRRGDDPEDVQRELEERRPDKNDPAYYARRTVANAGRVIDSSPSWGR